MNIGLHVYDGSVVSRWNVTSAVWQVTLWSHMAREF